MVRTEEDISAYIAYHSSISNNLALISGFIFTTIILLLTLLPDPTRPLVQLTLLILSIIFNLVAFQLAGEEALLGYCVKFAPKLPKEYPVKILNLLSPMVWLLLGFVGALMYSVLGLFYLALASAILTISTYLLGYLKATKHLMSWQKWQRVDLHADKSKINLERDTKSE